VTPKINNKEKNMFKSIVTVAALLASTAAFASDIPSRKAAPAPVFTQKASPYYVGVRGGLDYKKDDQNYTVGGNAGYEVNSYVRGEVGYDYVNNSDDKTKTGHIVTGNVIGQYPIATFLVTPYGLGGVGYRWADVKNEAIFNVGAGVRYGITKSFELDGRYRYISNFKNENTNNVLTLGVNYKF
jgi:opacity protein-like surface antigen